MSAATLDGPVLVTGATGNAGREVVRALLARGARVRAGVTAPARASLDGRAEPVALDFRRPETFGAAVAGASALFLLRPPPISDVRPTLNALADAALAAGVRRVTFLSVAGAEKNALVPHHAVEAHLKAGPRVWTLLRPGFFAQNLQDAYLRDVREDGRLYVPAGRGRVTFVDLADVAEVAADALTSDAHAGEAYTLTGPRAFTFEEVAGELTRALGRPVRYVPASVPGYLHHLRVRRGLPWAQALVQTVLHVGLRFGQAEAVDPTLARLLGRAPRTVVDYIREHPGLWAAPGA
jgi:uncharacterized protein YbjT (DUF2867 family)